MPPLFTSLCGKVQRHKRNMSAAASLLSHDFWSECAPSTVHHVQDALGRFQSCALRHAHLFHSVPKCRRSPNWPRPPRRTTSTSQSPQLAGSRSRTVSEAAIAGCGALAQPEGLLICGYMGPPAAIGPCRVDGESASKSQAWRRRGLAGPRSCPPRAGC